MMSKAPFPKKQVYLLLALAASFLLTYCIVDALSYLGITIEPGIYLRRAAICLGGFLIPMILGWMAYQVVGAVIFGFYAGILAVFVAWTSHFPVFLWFLPQYAWLFFVLYRNEEDFRDKKSDIEVEREKAQNELNDLEIAYRQKGEGISAYFEKYSTYYHLRKLAEELAGSLSVTDLAAQITRKCISFIPKGEIALIALADPQLQHLSVIASHSRRETRQAEEKHGDLFDFWVVRNRQRLIVNDTQQDFRFDVSKTMQQAHLRSLIMSPLLHEGRVIGTFRMNSPEKECFSNDDLRLLDAIGILASSAISNALLFERTEELAIRDSLTGLFVRRYFYDRLKEEHGRFLMTQRPLSLIMCDLDHFKESNDRFGHEAGDLMLMKFAEIIQKEMGDYVISRYGGEEFAVLLPETPKERAAQIADNLRQKVESSDFQIRRERVKMTISMGVASMPEDTLEIEALVQKSDQALYRAKAEGRNRVCVSIS